MSKLSSFCVLSAMCFISSCAAKISADSSHLQVANVHNQKVWSCAVKSDGESGGFLIIDINRLLICNEFGEDPAGGCLTNPPASGGLLSTKISSSKAEQVTLANHTYNTTVIVAFEGSIHYAIRFFQNNVSSDSQQIVVHADYIGNSSPDLFVLTKDPTLPIANREGYCRSSL